MVLHSMRSFFYGIEYNKFATVTTMRDHVVGYREPVPALRPGDFLLADAEGISTSHFMSATAAP